MMRLKYIVLLCTTTLLFAACSPKQRLARIIKNHPELSVIDTLIVSDTVTVPGAKVDSVFYYKQTDTVIVKQNGVTVKYYYNLKDSTVYIRGERDTIRIVKGIQVPYSSVTVEHEGFWEKLWRIVRDILLIAALGALLVLFLLLKKKLK